MGNMLGAEKVKVADEETLGYTMEKENVESLPCMSFKPVIKPIENSKKKMVRFQLDNHDEVSCVGNKNFDEENESLGKASGGVLKFRIAVTKEEQAQILNYKKGSRYPSVEELLEGMKVTSRKISHVKIDSGEVSLQKWKLALENIADHDPNH